MINIYELIFCMSMDFVVLVMVLGCFCLLMIKDLIVFRILLSDCRVVMVIDLFLFFVIMVIKVGIVVLSICCIKKRE